MRNLRENVLGIGCALLLSLGVSYGSPVVNALDRKDNTVLCESKKKQVDSSLVYVLNQIEEAYKDKIDPKSEKYSLISLGYAFEVLKVEGGNKYDKTKVVVPLKIVPEGGTRIIVNGRELSNYVQLESGIAVQKWVAEESGLAYKPYEPKEEMILCM